MPALAPFVAAINAAGLRLIVATRLEDERHRYHALAVKGLPVAQVAAFLARFPALAERFNARDGIQLTLKGGFNRPPKECLPAEEAAFPEWQRAAADVGVAPFTWVHGGGGSDGNFLTAGGLPNLDGVGPIGDNLHSNREFCRVETIAPRAQIVALFLHRVAAGEITLPPAKG